MAMVLEIAPALPLDAAEYWLVQASRSRDAIAELCRVKASIEAVHKEHSFVVEEARCIAELTFAAYQDSIGMTDVSTKAVKKAGNSRKRRAASRRSLVVKGLEDLLKLEEEKTWSEYQDLLCEQRRFEQWVKGYDLKIRSKTAELEQQLADAIFETERAVNN
jgi:hypothetical protein